MRKVVLFLLFLPLVLDGYENWSSFLKELYSSSAPYNSWGFVGETRGGCFFLVNIVYHEKESVNTVQILTPGGKIFERTTRSSSPIFDPEKFYYSGGDIEVRITGYGLDFSAKSPAIKFQAKPDRKFISPFRSIRAGPLTLDLPMWRWRFSGWIELDGIRYRVKWVRVYHFGGNKSFAGKIFVKSTPGYSIFGIVRNDGIFLLQKDGKFYMVRGAIVKKNGEKLSIVATEGEKKLFLSFSEGGSHDSESCRPLSAVKFQFVIHPPYYSVPGRGLLTCVSESE